MNHKVIFSSSQNTNEDSLYPVTTIDALTGTSGTPGLVLVSDGNGGVVESEIDLAGAVTGIMQDGVVKYPNQYGQRAMYEIALKCLVENMKFDGRL